MLLHLDEGEIDFVRMEMEKERNGCTMIVGWKDRRDVSRYTASGGE